MTCHRDGTVSYYSIHYAKWIRKEAHFISTYELMTFTQRERDRIKSLARRTAV